MDPKILDGYQCLWTFALDPTISLYEIETTIPGWTGRGLIDTTTMRNSEVTTGYPKALKSLTDAGGTVAYADSVLDSRIEAMIGENQLCTATLPTGKAYAFYGSLDTFRPGGMREGSMPTATITVLPTNTDLSLEEALPTLT